MDMKEAAVARHTVRKYTSAPLTGDVIEALNARIAEDNAKLGTDIQLVVNDESAFNAALKLVFAKGVKNYFLLCGDDAPDLDIRLGYASSDLMLYAQTLGLNTWWVGATFSRKNVEKHAPGKKVVGIVAVGYGVNQGTPHISKKPAEVSNFEGKAPRWFIDGIETALLAPTAMNKQRFLITGKGTKVKIACDNGEYAGVDTGIVQHHFEVGAQNDAIEWEVS